MPREDFDRYVSAVASGMQAHGFAERPQLSRPGCNDRVFHKREFSLAKFGMLDTFWHLAYVAGAPLHAFVSSYCPKHWASFEFPVLVELQTGQIVYYSSTPMWGALYYDGFRRQAFQMLSPR